MLKCWFKKGSAFHQTVAYLECGFGYVQEGLPHIAKDLDFERAVLKDVLSGGETQVCIRCKCDISVIGFELLHLTCLHKS